MFFTYFHVKTQKPSPLSNAIYTCQKDQNTNYVFIYTQTSNLIIFFIWREYSSVNATTVLIFHMSCFIIIHISPYLYHSDAWPLSHFLTNSHVSGFTEYSRIFCSLLSYVLPSGWHVFLSHKRISILCCLYSKIAGNVCILLALAWQLADCSKCTLYLEKSHNLNCEKDEEEEEEKEFKTSAGSGGYAKVESAIQHSAIYAGQELWHFIYSLMDL